MLDLDKEIEALESMLMRLKELKGHQAEAVGMVVKWQPKGGGWFIGNCGRAYQSGSTSETKEYGTERQTKEQAERSAVEMRRFNRLLALRDELCGGDVVDWNDGRFKYYVYFSHSDKEWRPDFNDDYESLMPYFTTEESAQRACDMLNSGEVEL